MTKYFPLMKSDDNRHVPYEVAEEAYKEYSAKNGTDQSLKRLGERGGFGQTEIIKLLFERIQRLQKTTK